MKRGRPGNLSGILFRAAVFSGVRPRPFFVLLVVTVLVLVFVGPLSAQQVRKADTVAPEDLGFTKFNFEATAGVGELVVFREDDYVDGKLVRRFESISHASPSGGKHAESVLLIDWAFFDGHSHGRRGGPYELRTGAGANNIDAAQVATRWMDRGEGAGRPPQASFTFQTAEDGKATEMKFVFTIFTEAYEAVKRRHPKLPDSAAEGWGFAGFVEDIKEP